MASGLWYGEKHALWSINTIHSFKHAFLSYLCIYHLPESILGDETATNSTNIPALMRETQAASILVRKTIYQMDEVLWAKSSRKGRWEL